MVINGATASRDPSMIAQQLKKAQNATALRGSSPGGGANILNSGMRPALPIAARRRGAPASDWSPAPKTQRTGSNYVKWGRRASCIWC